MGLLNPFLLALGLGAAVPLLLHMLQRHQGPRVVFPALRYLRRAEKESARRVRVRQLLLMLLRIAAVLLVTAAAARPFLRAGDAGHPPTAVVIILDNGLGSAAVEGDRRVLDVLKARALEALDAAGPDDRFWLLRAGSAAEPALPGDAAATALRVRETEPSAALADLAAALEHARTLLAASADGRAAEIHLLSVLQATGLPRPAPARSAAPPVVVWHPGTDAPPNRAVAAVTVGGGLAPVAGERTTVAAAITGDGAEPVNVRLLVRDTLVAAAEAPPGATAVLSLPALPAGIVTGRVEIDADALHIDDTRHFAALVRPPPTVRLAGALPFVSDALDVLEDAGRIRRSGGSGADVAIHAAGESLPAAAAGALVFLPPDAPEALPSANLRLAGAGVPWRFGPPLAGEARLAPPADDPLLRILEGARIQLAWSLVPEAAAPGDSVLLRTTDGAPWAVRGTRRGGGSYTVLASPLSPEASTIPVSAAMLPLLARLTGTWAAAQPPRTEFEPGALVTVPPEAGLVAGPDGVPEPVTPGSPYRLGDHPGAWLALSGDSVVAAWTVNAPAAASDVKRLDARALEARLPGWPLHLASGDAGWRRAVFRQRLGTELWRPLLLAALLLLIIESAAAAAGRARTAVAQPAAATEPDTT
jgi:hypothetical protein